MEEKVLTEIESKDYLLKIQEDKIVDLEKKIKRHENFLLISIYTIFPLALMGVLYLIEKIEQDPSLPRFFLFMIPVVIILGGVITFLGWIFEKIKDRF